MLTAETLNRLCYDLGITLYFKSSFDKANRTSASARGVGMDEGLRILSEVKEQFGLPILTDVHECHQCAPVAEVADVIQIPAFAAKEGHIWLTERGSSFGYGRLVVDMTSLVEMRRFGCPVVFDATHSVQQPSSQAGVTGGNREMVPYLMRAALAVGVDGLFIETHPNPDEAISDAANQVRLKDMRTLLEQALELDKLK